MADIFVSYQRSDEARARRLVTRLEESGLSVWWDKLLTTGSDWRSEIASELSQSRLVLVCWSEASVGPRGRFVQDEAGHAGSRLLPLLLDRVAPPLGFGAMQAIDLSKWRGSPTELEFRDLLSAIRARLEGQPPPRPKAPAARIARRFAFGGGLLGLLSVAGFFAWTAPAVRTAMCSLPVFQPALSKACCSVGFIEPTLVTSTGEETRSIKKAGYVRQGTVAMPTTAAARADVASRADRDALALCSLSVSAERHVTTDARITEYHCYAVEGGTVCAADYVASCGYIHALREATCG